MANPQLGSIGHFPTLLLSRRPGSLFTDDSPLAANRPAKIGFVRLFDSAFVRPKSQSDNN